LFKTPLESWTSIHQPSICSKRWVGIFFCQCLPPVGSTRQHNVGCIINNVMWKYQQAARMPAVKCFNNLETCRWDDDIQEMLLVYVDKVRWLTWWQDSNTWCYDVGYTRATGTMNMGQLYNVIHKIKLL